MNKKCTWVFGHNEWHVECGHRFPFDLRFGPNRRDFKFCPYCGEEIEVKDEMDR